MCVMTGRKVSVIDKKGIALEKIEYLGEAVHVNACKRVEETINRPVIDFAKETDIVRAIRIIQDHFSNGGDSDD